MSAPQALRNLLDEGAVLAGSCYDGLSAAVLCEAARAVLASRSDEPLQGLGLSPMALFELVGIREWDAFQSVLTADARKPV
ncbi:hypothetical protein H7I53_24145 [Mycolicibacterium pulveris]|uniref:Uncharacterized protein n=1 Tax=Mycolicibacterium pulveris TaxID=36813 RepID=A0A7I7URI5_MYCPV|nr:hypothetical protein [Mycolicibacterium pulveris]MCV6983294.1 hypothetical protein [Mycolicibacterium pulveris]BBY83169.1 hypothetical protein MPUL_43270 [Mycolicibacterium pulveris]